MNKLMEQSLKISLLGVAAVVCTGCPNPNMYGTPRTVAPGKLSHSVAVEAIGISATDGATGQDVSGTAPLPPSYQLRIGLAEQLDMGIRAANLTTLGADLKWNFLKSEVIDLAIDPGFQFSSISSGDESVTIFYLHGPLMLGINAGESVTFVPIAGISYGVAGGTIENDSASGSTGIMARLGLGVNVRVSDGFALHPEFSGLKIVDEESGDEGILYVFGLGFNFGKLPSYASEAQPPPL